MPRYMSPSKTGSARGHKTRGHTQVGLSTLIAAERAGRRCYGVEIDPHYVDLIVKAIRGGDGQSCHP